MVDADLKALLSAYERLLGSSASRPRRGFAIGTETFVVEHVRAVLGILQRHYSRRAAGADSPETSDDEDLRRVELFAQSLPTSRLGVRRLLIALLIVVMAQILSSGLGRLESVDPQTRVSSAEQTRLPSAEQREQPTVKRSELLDALSELPNLNVASLVKAARLVGDTDFAGASVIIGIAGFAAWLVLFPLAKGVKAARAIRQAERPRLDELERTVLASLPEEPPKNLASTWWYPPCWPGPAFDSRGPRDRVLRRNPRNGLVLWRGA